MLRSIAVPTARKRSPARLGRRSFTKTPATLPGFATPGAGGDRRNSRHHRRRQPYESAACSSTVDRLLATGKYIGGGVMIWPERWSAGNRCHGPHPVATRRRAPRLRRALLVPARGFFGRSAASTRSASASKISISPIASRPTANRRGSDSSTIWKEHIVTSCRKFDQFGDWYLVLQSRLRAADFLRQITEGRRPFLLRRATLMKRRAITGICRAGGACRSFDASHKRLTYHTNRG